MAIRLMATFGLCSSVIASIGTGSKYEFLAKKYKTPKTPYTTNFTMAYGTNGDSPQMFLSIDGSEAQEFTFRGFAYASTPNCCPVGQKDIGVYMKALYEPFIKRMAALGANALRVYDVPININNPDGPCDAPAPELGNCNLPTCVTKADVNGFLDYCLEHKIFVLLDGPATFDASRDADFYDFIGSTFGSHPAFAGGIMFDETFDSDATAFNGAAEALFHGICKAQAKDCSKTDPRDLGKIITTAFAGAVVSEDVQNKYGKYINAWGFDPYAQKDYRNIEAYPNLPFKPYFIMENGVNGAENMGCRNDCVSTDGCTSCWDFKDSFLEFARWTMTAPIAGHFLFEFSDEAWKANPDPCASMKKYPSGQAAAFWENNHGIFNISGSYPTCHLGAKTLDANGTTFESVLRESWFEGLRPDDVYGYRGWTVAPTPPPPGSPTKAPTPSPPIQPGKWEDFNPNVGCTYEKGGHYPSDTSPPLPEGMVVKRFQNNNYHSPANVVGDALTTAYGLTACLDCMPRCFLQMQDQKCDGIDWSPTGMNSNGVPIGTCTFYSSITALGKPSGGNLGPEYVVFKDNANLPPPPTA
jgi:hypothetical protein